MELGFAALVRIRCQPKGGSRRAFARVKLRDDVRPIFGFQRASRFFEIGCRRLAGACPSQIAEQRRVHGDLRRGSIFRPRATRLACWDQAPQTAGRAVEVTRAVSCDTQVEDIVRIIWFKFGDLRVSVDGGVKVSWEVAAVAL